MIESLSLLEKHEIRNKFLLQFQSVKEVKLGCSLGEASGLILVQHLRKMDGLCELTARMHYRRAGEFLNFTFLFNFSEIIEPL